VIGLVALAGPVAARGSVDLGEEGMVVVRAGDGEDGYAINAFLPASFTVAAGTTVRWEFPWFEPHTVTFGSPQTGAPQSTPSGSDYTGTGFHTSDLTFGPGKSYDVRFPEAGVFPFYCVTHAEMRGTVTVVASTSDDQSSITARGGLEFTAALVDLKAIARDWASRPDVRLPLPDGSTEHVVAIAGATSYGDVQQFFPPSVTVRAGDTVRWHSVVRTPHTATFGPFPGGLPVVGNPAVDDVYQPAAVYEGTGYWNSGVIGVDWPLGLDFAMQFGKPGKYLYYCILHDTQGMVGEIVVLPAAQPTPPPATPTIASTPRPPATGTGATNELIGGRPLGILGVVGVAALIGMALLLAACVRRRS
ncbi:MAG: plastocyanin/azurin family copper-binding protein, partial [Dehalococcoidia bacterium]